MPYKAYLKGEQQLPKSTYYRWIAQYDNANASSSSGEDCSHWEDEDDANLNSADLAQTFDAPASDPTVDYTYSSEVANSGRSSAVHSASTSDEEYCDSFSAATSPKAKR